MTDIVVMLGVVIMKADEKVCVEYHQHGCNDVTCKPRIVLGLLTAVADPGF